MDIIGCLSGCVYVPVWLYGVCVNAVLLFCCNMYVGHMHKAVCVCVCVLCYEPLCLDVKYLNTECSLVHSVV